MVHLPVSGFLVTGAIRKGKYHVLFVRSWRFFQAALLALARPRSPRRSARARPVSRGGSLAASFRALDSSFWCCFCAFVIDFQIPFIQFWICDEYLGCPQLRGLWTAYPSGLSPRSRFRYCCRLPFLNLLLNPLVILRSPGWPVTSSVTLSWRNCS